MKNFQEIIRIDSIDEKGRLDSTLAEFLPDMSRSKIQKLIKAGNVLVNGEPMKANYILLGNEEIIIQIPYQEEITLVAEDIPLEVVYEDDDLIIINKAVGMVVHPSKGHPNGTLVNALLFHFGQNLSQINDQIRPGIVHRIDKDTSGLILVAKNDQMHQEISQQLSDHSMGREYLAIVNGQIAENSGRIEIPLKRDPNQRIKYSGDKSGKSAITDFIVRERYAEATLIQAQLHTGRTHQIRVHFEHIGHPIVGDPLYRRGVQDFNNPIAKLNQGQYLHAYKLNFYHPTKGEWLSFETAMPERFERLIERLKA